MKRKRGDFLEDLGKRLKTRFKKSKDFEKTIKKLQQEGYTTFMKGYTKIIPDQPHDITYKYILFDLYVYKDNKEIIHIIFENNRFYEYETKKEIPQAYKQNIYRIYY